MTLKKIEELLLKHLEEAGQIRSDLAWLKRFHWVQLGAVVSVIATMLAAYFIRKP